ncbi:MAG TPA: hypothetical protein VG733_06165 [Chthoniobacteraceae bacterium]|nr:hypothetical protein [Chthoniobacteraceae bacterium]
MKTTLEEIHRAKAARRKALAALPFEEKIRIMEELQKMGRALIEARTQLQQTGVVKRD